MRGDRRDARGRTPSPDPPLPLTHSGGRQVWRQSQASAFRLQLDAFPASTWTRKTLYVLGWDFFIISAAEYFSVGVGEM